MLLRSRVRISAIVMFCAAALAVQGSAKAADAPEAPSEQSLVLPQSSPAINVDWMLRDNQQTLPESLWVIDHPPVTPNTLTLPQAPQRVNVNAVVASETPVAGSDKALPMPVLSVGWVVILCGILFHIGARVLRMGRTAA